MSRDRTDTLQPGQQSKIPPQKKKKGSDGKKTYMNRLKYERQIDLYLRI